MCPAPILYGAAPRFSLRDVSRHISTLNTRGVVYGNNLVPRLFILAQAVYLLVVVISSLRDNIKCRAYEIARHEARMLLDAIRRLKA